VLGLAVPHITEGSQAELTLFDPVCERQLQTGELVSRSHNTPFIGHPLVGRPLGIIAQGKAVLRIPSAGGTRA
jgi:dihydroorotase